MGVRANIVKKYVCEYEGSQAFNYRAEEVYTMLSDNDVNIWTSGGDGDYYGQWEINCNTNALPKYIATLNELPPDEVNVYFNADNPDDTDYTNQYVMEVLKEWMQYSDPVHMVIRVHWF
jgi:hypothetical protein